jgi:hypothetical protein
LRKFEYRIIRFGVRHSKALSKAFDWLKSVRFGFSQLGACAKTTYDRQQHDVIVVK